MAATNSTILGAIKLAGSNDYQQRVPDATASDFASTLKFIFDPMNRKYYNEFVNTLVQLIGTQKVHNKVWDNPLTPFKGEKLMYGQTIEEIIPKWITAHAYKDDVQTLLEVHKPEMAAFFHSVNRQDMYPISVNQAELQQAAMQEYGLNRIVNAIMNVPINSDNYDEYNLMMQLFAYYEDNWGFYKESMAARPTDEESGKAFLASLRAYATKLAFPNSAYSPVGREFSIPVFARPDELILIIDADADANVDVNTLASVFQLDKADIKYRKVVVPELPVPDAFAILTTSDFFVVNDYIYQTDSFYNPQNLTTNYYLHHWEVVSCSPAVPAIMFTTATGTNIPTVTQSVSGVSITPATETAAAGDTVQLTATLTGSVTKNEYGVEVKPDAVLWKVAASSAASAGTPVQLNSRTRVDKYGILHIQKTGLEAGNVITVTGTTVYTNPSGNTTHYTGTSTITIE